MSEQDKAFPSEVVFELEADPSYRIVASNGAMVGPTSRGEIKIDFFVESAKLPTKTINRLTAEHGLGEIISQEPDTQGAVFVRRLQVGLLLTCLLYTSPSPRDR